MLKAIVYREIGTGIRAHPQTLNGGIGRAPSLWFLLMILLLIPIPLIEIRKLKQIFKESKLNRKFLRFSKSVLIF